MYKFQFQKAHYRLIALLLCIAMLIAYTPPVAAVDYYPSCSSNETSLVDGLNEVGETDTSFNNRCKIAKANGIDSYAGMSEENIFLLVL